MKQNFLRRLGALALAFALTLTLVPTAWAAGTITAIELDDLNLTTASSGTTLIPATVTYDDGSRTRLPTSDRRSFKWKIINGDQGAVVVNADTGAVRVLREGTVTVQVISNIDPAIHDTCQVKVTAYTPPTFELIPNGPMNDNGDFLLSIGGSAAPATLTAEVGGSGSNDMKVEWNITSSNPEGVIAVRKQDPNSDKVVEVIPQKMGTATITATLYNNKDEKLGEKAIGVNVINLEMQLKRGNELINGKTLNLNQKDSLNITAAVLEADKVQRSGFTWRCVPDDVLSIEWTGSDRDNATITVKEGKSGTVNITVTSNLGPSDTFTVVVPKPGDRPVERVTLNQTELQLGLNETFDLVATVVPSNATSTEVEWVILDGSTNVSITEVDEKTGRVRADAVGTATIRVRSTYDSSKYADCKVTVAPGLTSLVIYDGSRPANGKITPKSNMSKPGQTQALEARIQPSNAKHGTVTWTSDNPGAVTVRTDTRYDSGLFAILTSVGPGEAKITVKCGDVEDSATVIIPGLVLSGGVLTMTNGKLSMKEGETDTLTYKAYGEAATLVNAVPNWISSDSSVVDVDRTTGAITARKSGTATITLELGSGNTYYEAKCEVTVVEDTSAIINAGTVNAGAAYKFDRLLSQIQSVCSNKVGGTLSYINNLSVADTEQGILHDEHHSSDDTGAGVGIQDRYYRSANASQGQRPLSDLSFVPRTTFNGTAEVSFTGWNTTGQPFNGLIRFTVNGTGDVMYASNEGAPVTFLADDFNFYHPNLKSVSFTPPQESVGTLYYNYTSASQPGTKVTSSTAYGRTSTPSLNRVTFVPAAGYQGTARIAYKGTDTSGRSFTGTVTITVTRASGSSADPADISYSVRENSWVTFRPSDFGNASRYTLGETLSYVRFTPPPSSEGTLFYNYRGFSDFDSMVNNTTSYYYGGNPALGGVSFVPTTTTPGQVDIGYTGYTSLGNTFEGTIHITIGDATEGGQQQLPLHYTVFTGRTVNLSASDFNTACRNATGYDLASVQFTRLPGVSQGTLRYTRGSSSTANNVTTSIRFYRTGTGSSANLIGNVYFQAGNNTGTVTIPFTGTDERGTTFTDEVTIVVTPPTASEITYSGTTASPIRLSSSRISSALSGAWNQSLSYITFTSLPSTTAGRLYLGYSGVGTGTQVNTGTRYYASGYPSIDQISFVPRGRYNGQVSVGYTAVSANGQSVSGRILFSISSTGSSSYFNDMAYHTWAAPSVDYLYQNQVTNGVTATQYGPNQRINRCDFVLMLCRAFKFSGSNGYSFADVPTNSYFSQAVATAKQLGIVSGDGNNFRPYGQVTRQDAMVMTYNALRAAGWNVGNASTSVLNQFSDSASVSSYARTAVSALVQMGAVNGDNGRLLPHNSITRAEAAVILHFVMTM